ncbi:MAG: hypothetical protein O8C61_09785 [Candidatus Methanoperedens sp.]|nr:hypothetical protein [Candidatus Methanoperedens sp.]
MIENSFLYGVEETIGLHVILSNIFWWGSLILVISAYRYRHIWNVGELVWSFLFMTFLFFGVRELGHLTKSPFLDSVRYIFGVWSAIFMTSAMIFIYIKLYMRKTISGPMIIPPFALMFLVPVIFIFLIFSGKRTEEITGIMSNLENIVWIIGSSITIYTTYLLGIKSTGGFINFYMFFHFAAIFALLWKFLGLLNNLSCPVPYSIREIMETLFGVFAIMSMIVLRKMFINLSNRIS